MKQRWIVAAMLVLATVLSACAEVPVNPKEKSPYAETPAKINAELGLGYMEQGDMKQAKQKLQLSLKYNPDYEKAHHYIAELYRRLGEYDKADKHFQRAIELAPEDSGLHNNYGAFLCEQKQYAQSEAQFLIAVSDPLYNGRVQAYENLGLCSADAGETAKAIKYLRTALKTNPKLVKSLFRLAEIYYGQRDYLRARAYLERYEDVGPATAESLWLGVRVEHYMGDPEMMKRYAVKLSRNFPNSPQWRTYTRQHWQ